jgi:eukaryotic-like serine/threonine-protein kinase
MSNSLTCPEGHTWPAAGSADDATHTCPVCGAAARLPTDSCTKFTITPLLPEPQTLTTAPAGARAAASALPTVPGYELLGELGRGGMGVVYQARQVKLDRIVALKMILAGGHAGASDLQRFRIEAQAIARLQHPNIVQVHEVGEHDSLPYYSLEYCAGGTLATKLAGTPLPPKDAATLIETLAHAMHAAHQKGILHRDLKPANILFANRPGAGDEAGERQLGTPKITDFGLAKKLDDPSQTASGSVMGTPSYMAPEQASGKSQQLKAACDTYALGAILYECLTGRPPFKAATPLDTIMQVLAEEPVPPRLLNARVPADLEVVCLKCLQKEPQQRYESAAALANDLRRWQSNEPIVARPVGRIERARKWAKRRPALAALLAMLALTVVGGTLGALYFTNELRWERDRARDDRADADKARTEAEQRERQARLNLYVARMRLAQSALAENELGQTIEILRSLEPGAGERDLRGFEWYFLWNQCHAERLRIDHPTSVERVVWTRDGRHLVTACRPWLRTEDQTGLFCWDAASGKPVWEKTGLATTIESIAASADGSLVLTVQSDPDLKTASIVTYEIASGKEVGRSKLDQMLLVAGLSPDGRWLAELNIPVISIWDTRTGKKVHDIRLHQFFDKVEPVRRSSAPQLTFSGDGKRLALVGPLGNNVVVVDVEAELQVAQRPFTGLVTALALDLDGNQLAMAGEDGTINVWQLNKAAVPVVLRGQSPELQGLTFSPNGLMLATAGSDKTMRLWNLSTGREERVWRAHRSYLRQVAFRADGQQVASASMDRTVKLWDVARTPGIDELFSGEGMLAQVAVDRLGRHLVCGLTHPAPTETAPVQLWKFDAKQQSQPVAFHPIKLGAAETGERRVAVALRADEPLLVQAMVRVPIGEEKVERSIHVTTARLDTGAVVDDFVLATPELRSAVQLQLSPTGRLLALSGVDRRVIIWDIPTRKRIATCTDVASPVYCMAFDRDGKWLASAETVDPSMGSAVVVWHALTGNKEVTLPSLKGGVESLRFRDDGRLLALAQKEFVQEEGMITGRVVLWDMEQGKVLQVMRQRLPVSGMAFSHDGQRLAMGGLGGMVRVFELASGEEVLSVKTTAFVVYSLAFSPDDQHLFAGCFMREDLRGGRAAVLVLDGAVSRLGN